MGKKWTSGFTKNPTEHITRPDKFAKRRFGELKSDVKGPQAPGATEAETQLQNRQREEIARLDDEENTRLKRGLRGQLGSRRLMSSTRRAKASTTGAGDAGGAGGGRVTIPRRPGAGSYA